MKKLTKSITSSNLSLSFGEKVFAVSVKNIHKMVKIQKSLIILMLFLILGFSTLSAQTEPSEPESVNPFTPEVSYIGDLVSNLSGGISKGTAYMGMVDVGIRFETEKTGWWKGGTLYVRGQNTHGGAATESLVGDLQVLSNIENGYACYLYEIWYQQTLGPVSVLFGKHDLNSEFVASEYAGLFLNSAFGIHSSVALNVPVSIFPMTSLGVVTSVQFSDAVALRMGVYDGNSGDLELDPHNVDFTLNPDNGLLAIGELQIDLVRNERHIGTYKIGSYYHSGSYDLFGKDNIILGNYGIYGVVDFDIIQKSPMSGKGLSAFLQLGWAPSDRNLNDQYIGAGFNYFGLLKGRSSDVLGLAFAHAEISRDAILSNTEDPVGIPSMKNFETAIELSYKIQLSDQISFQPDIQYILNPGVIADIDNALVALLRFEAQF
jgi:porin